MNEKYCGYIPKIGIDIDDTMFRNTMVSDIIKEFGLDIPKHSWDLHELPEEVREILYKRFVDPVYMCELKPFRGNAELLTKWHNEGYRIFGITARMSSIRQATLDMFRRYFPYVEDVFCMDDDRSHDDNKVGKNKIIIRESLSVLVDDSPKYIECAMALPFIRKFFVTNDETSYNWELRDRLLSNPVHNVTIVKSMAEVVL
jgi:hypothetical protein